MAFDDAVSILADEPGSTGVLTDFDGTLAPVVTRPEDARPLPGTRRLLGALARRFGVVAVVSGRPMAFLEEQLGDVAGIHLAGHYGLERRMPDGSQRIDERAAATVDLVATLVSEASGAAPAGLRVEDKYLSFALHWRGAAGDTEDQASRWARAFAQHAVRNGKGGLEAVAAKRVVEVRPAVGGGKGDVVRDLCAPMRRACYAGDDAGDVAAFDGLDDLVASRAIGALRVAVASDEVPQSLLERADLVVDGPEGLAGLFRRLVA